MINTIATTREAETVYEGAIAMRTFLKLDGGNVLTDFSLIDMDMYFIFCHVLSNHQLFVIEREKL